MKQALVAGVLFCIFYALQLVFQQSFVRELIQPLHLNFLSYSVASLVLLIYFLIFNRKKIVFRPDNSTFLFFLLALAGWMCADFFAVYGLKFSSSVNYSIISRTMIFAVFGLSVLFLGEKVKTNKVIAAALSFLGVLLVVYNFKSRFIVNAGDLFFLGTVLTQSISSISRQKIGKNLSALQLTFLLFFYAAMIFGLITLLVFPINYPLPYGFIVFNAATGLIGFSLVNYSIQKGGAVFFTLISNLLPFFTILFAFIFLKQQPLITQITGGILIVISILIFQQRLAVKSEGHS